MSGDKLSFLDDDNEPEIELEEPQADPSLETGASEAEAETQAETGEEMTAPPADQHGASVPVSVILAERDKRQAAEQAARDAQAQIAQLHAQMQQLQARMQPKPQPAPDFFEDPEAAIAHTLRPVQQQVQAQALQQSRFFAEREFGADTVEAAMAYYDNQPREVSQRFLSHPSPFHAAVEHYQRQAALDKIGPDPDAYINAEVERRLQDRLAKPQSPAAPPPSLTAAPGAGGRAMSPGSAFDALFGD